METHEGGRRRRFRQWKQRLQRNQKQQQQYEQNLYQRDVPTVSGSGHLRQRPLNHSPCIPTQGRLPRSLVTAAVAISCAVALCPAIADAFLPPSARRLLPTRPSAATRDHVKLTIGTVHRGVRKAWSMVAVEDEATGPTPSAAVAALSLGDAVRKDFPILDQEAYPGKPLVYLDSAATSQKPSKVLEVLRKYYELDNANVHRGAHQLSIRATEAYELAREKVASFVNAETSREIVFTRGATEAINLVAQTWGLDNIGEGDEIVTTVMEHHSNLVPWQLLAQRKGAVLKFAQLREDMSLDVEHMKSLITERTKLVTMVHVSNALGCINPVEEVAAAAHAAGAKVLVDGCQSVPNMPVDVKTLGADWLVASGHKMCGPTGIGFLWGRLDVLETMPPWQGGGEMIDQVFFDHSTFAEPPARFEAGTPAIAQAVGLGAACDYLAGIGMETVAAYEHDLSSYLWDRVSEIEGLDLYGPPSNAEGSNRNPLVAFNSRDVHAHDLSFFMDQDGVAIRAGHHCTQALHRQLGAAGSLRASLYLYNTREDVDRFVEALKGTLEMFKGMDGGDAAGARLFGGEPSLFQAEE